MNYVKLFENFQLVPKRILNTGNDKFFGEKADSDYVSAVREAIKKIALEEHGENETVLKETEMQLIKEDQQLDAIIHNCKNRNFRPQYAAEVAFYSLVNGRIEALKDREPMFGGLKESFDPIAWHGRDVEKRPVIGTITTKSETYEVMRNGKNDSITIPEVDMDVVEVLKNRAGVTYVINKWYKPGVPQLVHEDMVKEFKLR